MLEERTKNRTNIERPLPPADDKPIRSFRTDKGRKRDRGRKRDKGRQREKEIERERKKVRRREREREGRENSR